jgi:hypothetical protein
MEFIDIIKKLNKIDELEKENKLNPEEMEEHKNNLEISQTSVDLAYSQYKKTSDKLEKSFKFGKLAYVFGSLSIVFLVSVLLSALGIFPESVRTGVYIGSIIGFIVFVVAYLVTDSWVRKHIYEWKRSRKYFIDLQNKFISDYLETLVYGYKIDLKMYKDIYKNIYDVQEYLRENDKKGFNSFNKAFEALKIDLSKYTNKVEEPHVKLVDISE